MNSQIAGVGRDCASLKLLEVRARRGVLPIVACVLLALSACAGRQPGGPGMHGPGPMHGGGAAAHEGMHKECPMHDQHHEGAERSGEGKHCPMHEGAHGGGAAK